MQTQFYVESPVGENQRKILLFIHNLLLLKMVAAIEIFISDLMKWEYICYECYAQLQLKETFVVLFKLVLYKKTCGICHAKRHAYGNMKH